MRHLLTLALVTTLGAPVTAADKPAGPSADPKNVPLTLSLVAKTPTYKLDLGGMTADEFKKAVQAGGRAGPKPPAVDLVAVVTNTGSEPLTLWASGDAVVLTLDLKGPGAVNADAGMMFTREFRIPKGVDVAAGKTVEFPVRSLSSGFRGAAQAAYWTAPGGYELTATLKTGVSPAPAGAADAGQGFGTVTLTSAPAKLTVEAAK